MNLNTTSHKAELVSSYGVSQYAQTSPIRQMSSINDKLNSPQSILKNPSKTLSVVPEVR